ncbi:DEAD/DEAH box helicase family protein [Deltaproteobacteria bacterium OttesenSCG-928-M10]|nr:DEAD/DEAH box helicase family protein [Deltaproteobacteria bacterium OttesenSCG-928-M10]
MRKLLPLNVSWGNSRPQRQWFRQTCLLKSAGVKAVIVDKSQPGRPIKVGFLGELRKKQELAAKSLLAHNNGVLPATTAFGKTVTAAYLIASRKVNTLILVHTQALLSQWKTSLERFLHFMD